MPRRVVRCSVCVVVIVALIVIAGCSPSPPSREPDMRGTITSVTRSGETGSLLLEEKPGDTGDAKASVSISASTTLFRTVAGASPEPITLEDVTEGMAADAWFTGPVAESYPVQAQGESVLVSE